MSLRKHVYATHICRIIQKQLYNVLPMKKLYLELDILAQLILFTRAKMASVSMFGRKQLQFPPQKGRSGQL